MELTHAELEIYNRCISSFCQTRQELDLIIAGKDLGAIKSAGFSRVEVAAGSDLHRGVYCPSPVFDLVVGNTHRGRVLKRPTSCSKITHRYYFDSENQLAYVEHAGATEYLFRTGNVRYGYTPDPRGVSAVITKEVYEADRIKEYLNAFYFWMPGYDQQIIGGSVRIETYTYEQGRIAVYELNEAMLTTPILALSDKYHFDYSGDTIIRFQKLKSDGTPARSGWLTCAPRNTNDFILP